MRVVGQNKEMWDNPTNVSPVVVIWKTNIKEGGVGSQERFKYAHCTLRDAECYLHRINTCKRPPKTVVHSTRESGLRAVTVYTSPATPCYYRVCQ